MAKSRQYGIVTRDLRRLTGREVSAWGQNIDLTLYFYEYSELEVALLFAGESIPRIDVETLKAELRSHPCIQSLFRAAAQKLGEANLVADKPLGRKLNFDVKIESDHWRLCGEILLQAALNGAAHLVGQQIAAPAVYAYGEPNNDSQDRAATILDFATLGHTSITQKDEKISVFLDLSQVEVPHFWQFRYFEINSQQDLDHEAIEIYGIPDKVKVAATGVKVSVCSPVGWPLL